MNNSLLTAARYLIHVQMVLNDLSCRGDESSIIQCGQSGVKGCQYNTYVDAAVNCMSGKVGKVDSILEHIHFNG